MFKEVITNIFSPSEYLPHGNCFLWQNELVWLHAIADILIAIAYYSIGAMLFYFIKKREDIPFKWLFLLFATFIFSCGTVHILEVWTLWYPAYWLSGVAQSITAVISLYTVIEVFPVIPQALALPSPEKLAALNQQLETQILERCAAEEEVRQLNQELEKRVIERTAALEKVNDKLSAQIRERRHVESALWESQIFAQRIADLTPNILYIYDVIQEQTIYCNHFIREILGYSPEKVKQMGKTAYAKLLHPSDLEAVMKHFQKCHSLKELEFLEIEYRIKDAQGKWHWLLSRETIFERDNEGKVKQTLGVASDITERKQTELALQELTEKLAHQVTELENLNQEMVRLGEMSDFLQACMTVDEAKKAIADLLQPLFPNTSGSVYFLTPNESMVEAVAIWGTCINSASLFNSSECWALRRGAMHQGDQNSPSLYCQHIDHQAARATLCVPMMAQGETLGLLYLSFNNCEQLKAKKRLVETVSKQIALAFANLKLQEDLRDQGLRDPLTSLFNRRYLEESLNRELHLAARKQIPLGAIMLDIDHFKNFNDTFGHEAGDIVLQEVGSFLLKNVRESDIPCRYGGEELTIIMPEANLENTLKRAEQIREGIRNLQLEYHGKFLGKITVSLGVACFPEHGNTVESLLRSADRALYRAKEEGRDRTATASSHQVISA